MKKVQYDDFWLLKDARNTGFLFEYCDKVMKELYGVDINIEQFLIAFMNSNVRKKMEAGNPRLLSQSYVDTIECFITVDCNGDYEQFRPDVDTEKLAFSPLERVWIGRMYVKIAYRFDLNSAKVIDLAPIWEMSEHFQVGHEISDETYLDSVRHIFG